MVSESGLLTNRTILQIQEVLEDNNAGFRKLHGTALKSTVSGDTVYTPPQDYEEIMRLMSNLEKYINDSEMCEFDPLVKLAIIHFQFEGIHPFMTEWTDRQDHKHTLPHIGKLQSLPILYLSSYIIKHKPITTDFYKTYVMKICGKNGYFS